MIKDVSQIASESIPKRFYLMRKIGTILHAHDMHAHDTHVLFIIIILTPLASKRVRGPST